MFTNPISRAALAASLLLSSTNLAAAHAGISPASAENGQSIKAAITIPHGCDGAPTDTVIIKLPEGFIGARPQAKAGWSIETLRGDYARAYDDHGTPVSSGALEIRWSGGSLPDDQFDEFVISGTFQSQQAGAALPFLSTQLCGDKSVVWDQIAQAGQDPHALERPAPTILIGAAAASGEHGHGAPAAQDQASVGNLALTGGFARATIPNAPVGGGYVTITNSGAEPDRLLGGSSPAAEQVQIHEMRMENDIMRMRPLADGLEIPAGGSVTLAPGGLHLMFLKPRTGFVEGGTVPVTLNFEKAGAVELDLPIAAAGADAPAGDHSAHGH